MDTANPLQRPEMVTAPTTIVESVPEHGKHTTVDAGDSVLANEEKKRAQAEQQRGLRAMKGFVPIFTCPKCHKRVEPRVVGSEVAVGKCPYCASVIQPESRSMYTGEGMRPVDKHMTKDHAAFQMGANQPGCQITRKIMPFRSPLVQIER